VPSCYNVSYLNHLLGLNQFTGVQGVMVSIEERIKGFKMIMDGEVDYLPRTSIPEV